MHFFIDKKHNTSWFTHHKNGSTTLRNLASFDDNSLEQVGLEDFFQFIDKNSGQDYQVPVYTIFRNPYVRFRSGLTKLANRHQRELGPYRTLYSKEHNFQYFLQCAAFFNDKRPSIIPYHLYDTHIDHILWMPAIVSVCGYNVKLIPMTDLSALLINMYDPDSVARSDTNIRPNSYNEVNPDSENFWSSYKKIIINGKNSSEQMFNQWMQTEQDIFDVYEKPDAQANLHLYSQNIVDKLLQDPYYFTDLDSFRFVFLTEILEILNTTHKLPSNLYHYLLLCKQLNHSKFLITAQKC